MQFLSKPLVHGVISASNKPVPFAEFAVKFDKTTYAFA